MIWKICFAASLVMLILSLLYAATAARKYRIRRLPRPFHIIFAGVFAAVFVGLIPPLSEMLGGNAGQIASLLLIDLLDTIQVFTINFGADLILDNIGSAAESMSESYTVYMFILFCAAPFLTFGFIISLFQNLAAEIEYLFRFRGDVYAFSELNGKSLDDIFYEFNEARPADYKSYSLSASDIIALNQGGAVSYHYVDRFGFKELPDFAQDNPLKNAEISVEDDYNMVDGIINNGSKQPTVEELEQQAKSGQPISLMDLADAVHREKEVSAEEIKPKRMSIYEQLRQPVPQQPSAPKAAKKHQQER